MDRRSFLGVLLGVSPIAATSAMPARDRVEGFAFDRPRVNFYRIVDVTKDDVVAMVKEGARSAVMKSAGYTNAALKRVDRQRLLEG